MFVNKNKKISLNEIAIHPKTNKRINVKSYVTHEGKQVGTYSRTQLINLNELKTQPYKSVDEFIGDAQKARERYNESPTNETFQKEILGLYQDGEHTIQDPGFDKHPDHLGKVFENAADLFSWVIPQTSVTRDQAFDILTNPDKIKERHKSSLELENFFNKSLKMETERTNIFSFKTKLNLDELDRDQLNGAIYEQSKKVIKKTCLELEGKIGKPFKEDYNLFDWICAVSGELLNKTELSERMINSKILSPLFSSTILGTKDNKGSNRDSIQSTIIPLNKEVVDLLKNKLPEDYHNLDMLLGDPQDIKNNMIKTLNGLKSNSPKFDKDRRFMIEAVKQMDMREIPHQFSFMMENDSFSSILHDKNVINTIDNFTKKLTDVGMDEIKTRSGFVHFTNNPMEIVTMSPEGKITSCQSITKEGKLGVNAYNFNIISSLHKPNDFISVIPTPSDTKIKRERISLNFQKEDGNGRLYNFEDKAVYGQDGVHENMSEFFQDNKYNTRLGKSYEDARVTDDLYGLVEAIDVMGKSDEQYKTHHQLVTGLSDHLERANEDFIKLKENSKESKEWTEQYKTKEKEYNDYVTKINNSNDSIAAFRPKMEKIITGELVNTAQNSASFLYGSVANVAIDQISNDRPANTINNMLDEGNDYMYDLDDNFNESKDYQKELSNKYHAVYKNRFGS